MQIRLIQVGKTKHQFIQDAEVEYRKRLRTFADLKTLQIKEFGVDSDSPALRRKAIEEEGKAILALLDPHHFLIVLDERGQQLTSPEFAQKLTHIRDFEGGKLDIVIGGPFGLSEALREKAKLVLSFSKFTFTHEQIRLLLLEQLYRASTILANKTYHY